jgi:hypothetical protein
MFTVSLTVGTWYEFVSLDEPQYVVFQFDSPDPAIVAFEPSTPDSASAGFSVGEGINTFAIPFGKKCWIKLISGAADITYSQFGGIEIDIEKCAYAVSDTITVDEVVPNAFPVAGFDDSAANQLTYVGLLHTEAANLADTATIAAATITLQFASFRTGRTLRIYGIEEAASITVGLTDYLSLASGQTLTTAFEDVTLDGSGSSSVDLTAILQELIDNTPSWSTSSPVQLWIGDISSVPSSGLNETATIIISGRASALFVRT